MKTIAIIDDDAHIGDLLAEVLTREGYGVLRAYSGTEALYLLSRHRLGAVHRPGADRADGRPNRRGLSGGRSLHHRGFWPRVKTPGIALWGFIHDSAPSDGGACCAATTWLTYSFAGSWGRKLCHSSTALAAAQLTAASTWLTRKGPQ